MFSSDFNLGVISSSLTTSLYPSQCHSHVLPQLCHGRNLAEKFHFKTSVRLETGESKSIHQLTSKDLLTSANQSSQYSSLLARIEYIGEVDKCTGRVELRFYIYGFAKTTSFVVLQEMPFFAYQSSSWSSVSPEYTRRLCGLHCQRLKCGDLIIAITEQRLVPSKRTMQPDYTQQSPTKSLVERYMNQSISSNGGDTFENKRVKTADKSLFSLPRVAD